MSFNDARFHHTFQCLSLNVKDQYWERDLAEHEVWLPNWRRHQAKAGAVRALGRGSRLRIPRRRASPMLKSSWASASTKGWLVDIFCAWLKWDYDSPKCTPFVPLRGRNKYKKKGNYREIKCNSRTVKVKAEKQKTLKVFLWETDWQCYMQCHRQTEKVRK